MPANLLAQVAEDPWTAVAIAEEFIGEGNRAAAEDVLQQVEKAASARDQPLELELALANLWQRTGNELKAEALLKRMVLGRGASAAVWESYIGLLHNARKDEQAARAIVAMPEAVRSKLTSIADTVLLFAAIHNASARYSEEAVDLLRAQRIYLNQHRPMPDGLSLQLGWACLHSGMMDCATAASAELGRESDLNAEERSKTLELSAAVLTQQAHIAEASTGWRAADAVLSSALRGDGNMPAVRAQLAGLRLRHNDLYGAYALYKHQTSPTASLSAAQAAIGSALAVGEYGAAKTWIRQALMQWPRDARLLHLAALIAWHEGHLQTSIYELRSSLQTNPQSGSSFSEEERRDTQDTLALAMREASPYLETSTIFSSRSGAIGSDRLSAIEEDMRASEMFRNDVRVTVRSRAIAMSSGTRSSASGVGVESDLEIMAPRWGAFLGSSPQSFAIQNFTGGVSVKIPAAQSEFSLNLERKSMEDSVLSWAGWRDRSTGLLMGGVVADAADAIYEWKGERHEFRSNLGYQFLTGTRVEDNQQVHSGLRFMQIVSRSNQQTLKLGMATSGMHFDRDLHGFSYGQGGYFSPQHYFDVTAPIEWEGRRGNRLDWDVIGSVGMQSFLENGAAAIVAPVANTGFKYELIATARQRLAGKFAFVEKLDLNNAPSYNAKTFGVILQYTLSPGIEGR